MRLTAADIERINLENVAMIKRLEAKAYRAGQEAMREAAAAECRRPGNHLAGDREAYREGYADACEDCAVGVEGLEIRE